MQTLNQCADVAGDARMCACLGGEKGEEFTTKGTQDTKGE